MSTPNPLETGLLHYLHPEQLALIQSKRIGIGGAGGLGSNLAVALVRTGFRYLEIIDQDVVEPQDLNRQDYTLDNIGWPKVEALKERLYAINPDITVLARQQPWDEKATEGLFAGCDIIIDAYDKAEWKFRFVEYYWTRVPHVICGNGMAGLTGDDITALKRIGNLVVVGDGTTMIEDGHSPLAPRIIQCAAKMAEVALGLTLGLKVT